MEWEVGGIGRNRQRRILNQNILVEKRIGLH